VQVLRKGYGIAHSLPDDTVIMPGDILWSDYGVTYLMLNTDQQEVAYVLRHGETDAPQGLKDALKNGNRVQDILRENIKVGRTGDEAYFATAEQCRKEGLGFRIYTHPINYHGHGAGPSIGNYNIAVMEVTPHGKRVIHDNTVFSMELFCESPVPEWDGDNFRVQLEQEVMIHNGEVTFVDGRQTEFHLI